MSDKQIKFAFPVCFNANRLQSIVIFARTCHQSTDDPFDIQMTIVWRLVAEELQCNNRNNDPQYSSRPCRSYSSISQFQLCRAFASLK